MSEGPSDHPDSRHEAGAAIDDDAPTLSGLPDDAPEQLRATLSGGDPEHLPTDDVDRGADGR